jgi:DUF4097 and DUF4098 domain-containing protein YvlB
MKRQVQMLLFVVFAMMLLASVVSAARDKQHRHSNNISMNDNDEAPGDDCATHFQISSDDRNVARGEEEHTIAAGTFQTLRLEPGRNGGVLLRGWDQPNVKVKICKAGVGYSQSDANAALKAIQVTVNGGDVRSTGLGEVRDDSDHNDSDQRTWVQYIVQVPANISTEMTTWNGPLSILNVKGSVSARTQNGPISFKHASGTLTAEAHNGPIEVRDSSGKLTLSAQNGPLDIELANQNWQGAGLEARTHNGPIDLKVPSNYQSGIDVQTSGRAPVSCDLKTCEQNRGAWNNNDDGERHIRLGASDQPVLIKMSTENGPVSISSTMY